MTNGNVSWSPAEEGSTSWEPDMVKRDVQHSARIEHKHYFLEFSGNIPGYPGKIPGYPAKMFGFPGF